MNDDFERDPLARELRDSLARHAAEAPRGDLLAERIIHAAEQPIDLHERRSRGWRTWALPLAAMGAVAAVVGAVIGIQNYHPTASTPAATTRPSPSQTLLRSPAPVSSTTTKPSPTGSHRVGASDLTGVQIQDLTFAFGKGWALGSADCANGSGSRCTAMLQAAHGTDWQSIPNGGFNVPGVKGCASPCVTNLRFADQETGYAFGPSAFFMTTDGGASWHSQRGGAIALETYRQNVIRVTASRPTGCPGLCNLQVETSGIGSTSWTRSSLGAGTVNAPVGVQLVRGGDNAYLLIRGRVTGGTPADTVLYRSANDGRNWTKSIDPCLPASQPVAAIALAAGGNRVSALCEVSTGPAANASARFLATSHDAGANFSFRPNLRGTPDLLAGDPATVLVAGGTGGLQRSTDGGNSWHTVPDVAGPVTWVGFESQTVGRAVTDGNTIWTTHDGGQTWRAVTFN